MICTRRFSISSTSLIVGSANAFIASWAGWDRRHKTFGADHCCSKSKVASIQRGVGCQFNMEGFPPSNSRLDRRYTSYMESNANARGRAISQQAEAFISSLRCSSRTGLSLRIERMSGTAYEYGYTSKGLQSNTDAIAPSPLHAHGTPEIRVEPESSRSMRTRENGKYPKREGLDYDINRKKLCDLPGPLARQIT